LITRTCLVKEILDLVAKKTNKREITGELADAAQVLSSIAIPRKPKKERVLKPIDPSAPFYFRKWERNENRQKIGLLVAELKINYDVPECTLTIGWSQVHGPKGDLIEDLMHSDIFIKERANAIAMGRFATSKYQIHITSDNLNGHDPEEPLELAETVCYSLPNQPNAIMKEEFEAQHFVVPKDRMGNYVIPLDWLIPNKMRPMVQELVERSIEVANKKIARYRDQINPAIPALSEITNNPSVPAMKQIGATQTGKRLVPAFVGIPGR